MERPSKRRRIERRFARPPKDFLSGEENHTSFREVDAVDKRQRNVNKRRQVNGASFKLTDDPRHRPPEHELRQLAPTGAINVVEDLAKPVGSAGTAVLRDTLKDANSAVEDVVQHVDFDVIRPVSSNLIAAGPSDVADAPQPPRTSSLPTSTNLDALAPDRQAPAPQDDPQPANPPDGSKLVDTGRNEVTRPVNNIPGLVSPLPAVAAADARTQALATELAQAEQKTRVVPSSEGPAPPVTPSATPRLIPLTSQSALSIKMPGAMSQETLSRPSTPLSGHPEATASPSSYLPSSYITTSTPSTSRIPNPVQSAPPVSVNNSTLPASSTLTPSSATTSLSQFPASSASRASIASINSMSQSASLTSSAMAAQTQTSYSSGSHSATSGTIPTTSTLLTLTSATSQSRTQSSAALSTTGSESSPSPPSGVFGGTPTSGLTPAASTSAGSAHGDGSGMPPTRVLVGGIVGGVAGAALLLVAALLLLRWRRGRVGQRRNISPPVPQTADAGSAALGGGGTMTQRSSSVPIAAAGFFGRLRPSSSQTAATTDTAPSERGFQKISGRKIPSVLRSGGDGYGESPSASSPGPSTSPPPKGIALGQGPAATLAPGLRPSTPHTLSGSSFYRNSQGFYGGVVPVESPPEPTDPSASPTSLSPTVPLPPSASVSMAAPGLSAAQSGAGIPNIRPGPARQPVISQGGVVPMRTPSHPQQPRPRTESPIAENPAESRRDPLGRSHPSRDGSRQSRFQESTTS